MKKRSRMTSQSHPQVTTPLTSTVQEAPPDADEASWTPCAGPVTRAMWKWPAWLDAWRATHQQELDPGTWDAIRQASAGPRGGLTPVQLVLHDRLEAEYVRDWRRFCAIHPDLVQVGGLGDVPTPETTAP